MMGVPDAWQLRIGAGPGAFEESDTGTIVGAGVLQADACAFFATHLGVLFGARWVALTYNHDRLRATTGSFGIRIH
jgi:hypothetical protein